MVDWFQRIGAGLGGWIALATAFCVVIGSYLYTRFATRRQLEDGDRALETRVIAIERSIERLNAGLKNTPTRAEHHELKLEMQRLEGGMNVLSERLAGMTTILGKLERPLDILVEYHMNLERRK